MELNNDTKNAVFTAAAASTDWRTTNLGSRVQVNHGGETYTVQIDPSGRYLAEITYCQGYGGVEFVKGANATPVQHRDLVKAAKAQK